MKIDENKFMSLAQRIFDEKSQIEKHCFHFMVQKEDASNDQYTIVVYKGNYSLISMFCGWMGRLKRTNFGQYKSFIMSMGWDNLEERMEVNE